MSDPVASHLTSTLERVGQRSASGIVSRARIASPGFNAALQRRLSAPAGTTDSLLADPVFEAARTYEPGPKTLGALAGNLLSPDLVDALGSAQNYRMSSMLTPYRHQFDAWTQTLANERSVLVSSGTGSGKTECFLIPVLDDLLRLARPGASGIRAIILYPLNALIESQRERLDAWAGRLGGRVRFALYNGDTKESAKQAGRRSTNVELSNRRDIRAHPPEILVTNITMLEYMLLRAEDRPILEASRGALRWIVLDEAHSYVGSQAAEMALLLRRVRNAFGVEPNDVRLVATSATIGGDEGAHEKLTEFLAELAGQPRDRVKVITGTPVDASLPAPGLDRPLDLDALARIENAAELYGRLADHPRLHRLKHNLTTATDGSRSGVSLGEVARILFDDPGRRNEAQGVLDAAARAEKDGRRLLAWRAHVFHRAQGGVWACLDPACTARDPELTAPDAGWPFGAISLVPRDRCGCGALMFEVLGCAECGAPHLVARQRGGITPFLEPLRPVDIDEYASDIEPDDDEAAADEADAGASHTAWIAALGGSVQPVFVAVETGAITDNSAREGRSARHALVDDPTSRTCCTGAQSARLVPLRYGPAFLIGNAVQMLLEGLSPPGREPSRPLGGRRALTFTDSRQGVARLAAKLQQDSERTLTRSFLWHCVQERSEEADPEAIKALRDKIERYRSIDADGLADEIDTAERALELLTRGNARPIPWGTLVDRFARQKDLVEYAGAVWEPRGAGEPMWGDPRKLAEMFLLRELLRRPRVQNNAETMGLLRLAFPALEEAAHTGPIPAPLRNAGVDADGWTGLLLAAIDFAFRNYLAADIDSRLVPLISPRFGRLNDVVLESTPVSERSGNTKVWPTPQRTETRLHRIVAGILDDNDPDRMAGVLEAMWTLLRRHAVKDTGRGAYRLDFDKAAVTRLTQAWWCPVTRRPIGYAVAGKSPFDVSHAMTSVEIPQLPIAAPNGLTEAQSAEVERWTRDDPNVAAARRAGLWSDLHDRVAAYPGYLRAQEHSAQLDRPVLKGYETEFSDGRINLLNCSTTMEMGVDLPDVPMVVNSNVPPSLSNYRQRVGRAGRRSEPWAFGVTFCRDLPLDRTAFDDPSAFLGRPIAAPKVLLDSAQQVRRHINVALLGLWLRAAGGVSVHTGTGAFLGAGDTLAEAVQENGSAARFISELRGAWGRGDDVHAMLRPLVLRSALEATPLDDLVDGCADALERIEKDWHGEHRELLERAAATDLAEVRQAFEKRSERMRGEFLLPMLVRRGFAPGYGFPTDVVTFDHLESQRYRRSATSFDYAERRDGASRQRDVAIREYAPGAEVVIDGLVHRSEGIRPAWSAGEDASRLEDLQTLWDCRSCGGFGLSPNVADACPTCGQRGVLTVQALRPVGFLGFRPPHTGYENLAHVPFSPPRISAEGASWVALADPAMGRLRARPDGLVLTESAAGGSGYAICLECGRAAAMVEVGDGFAPEVPQSMKPHQPLARSKRAASTGDRYCAGGHTQASRVLERVHLVSDMTTDVFELQLPHGADRTTALALAAALREALARRLGIEAEEIGLSAAHSRAPDGSERTSVLLHDRVSGGAGLVTRLSEPDMFRATLSGAAVLLDCELDCSGGCPACVLRPDLNINDVRLDRRGAAALAARVRQHLDPPEALRLFGAATQVLGRPLSEVIEHRARASNMQELSLYLHGEPESWDFAEWSLAALLPRIKRAGVDITVVMATGALVASGMSHGTARRWRCTQSRSTPGLR